MTIQIKKEVMEEVEVTFPMFTKNICYFAKIISMNEMILVYYSDSYGYEVSNRTMKGIADKWVLETPCTENEFIDACVTAIHNIQMTLYPEGTQIDTHQLSPGLQIAS